MTKKLSLINVADYREYTAYWEIVINPETWEWVARLYDRKSGNVLDKSAGQGSDENDARKQSQEWVLSVIDSYAPEEV